ncbi:MAG TPA: alkaline phosphatase family protein [Gemmatimonadales bacterium]|nr:alkaline phosphatase family protein [Gemmatimonadales bacterium]
MRERRRLSAPLALLLASLLAGACAGAQPVPAPAPAPGPPHVLLVTLDGLRWQEAFGGADSLIVWSGADSAEVARAWWRPTREERRTLLLPFLWGEVARRGQLFGDRAVGGGVRVTNGKNFSYPGYNELLTGRADDRIASNDKVPNPNVTVLEWLHRRPGFAGRVVAAASWDAFPWIINAERSGVPVEVGQDSVIARMAALLPRLWSGTRLDLLTHRSALDRVWAAEPPRVLYVALGETDEWAHAGEYARYLDAAHRNDAMIRELYEAFAAHPAVRGNVTLVVTVDHGRGDGPAWTDHGTRVPVAEWVWVGAMGPRVAPRGARADGTGATLAQVAATIAAAVGEDYTAVPGVAGPLPLD